MRDEEGEKNDDHPNNIYKKSQTLNFEICRLPPYKTAR